MRLGVVVSNKMDKTIVVRVTVRKKHPMYGKYINCDTTLYAHDENNICQIGDKVQIKECRPYSKLKCWRLLQVMSKSQK